MYLPFYELKALQFLRSNMYLYQKQTSVYSAYTQAYKPVYIFNEIISVLSFVSCQPITAY